MAFLVEISKDLLHSFNYGNNRNWRDLILLAGLYYTTKVTINTVDSLYNGFKTFCLPLIWQRDFQEEYGPWAVITGCSKGIGLCYAHELAKRGMNLVLIARKVELLNKIADEIMSQYKVKVEVIIADFGAGPSIYKNIEDSLLNKDIGVLVNNVGVANNGVKYFDEDSEDKMWNMINVNIGAMTIMSKMILPRMEERKKGAIINVASIASFGPQPFISMYSATKAYVDFLSRGLHYEYSGKGITVQCVCPGPVMTDMLIGIMRDGTRMRKWNPVVPNVNTYTSSAIRTLGFSHHTTGYWKHTIFHFIRIATSSYYGKLCYYGNRHLMETQKLEKKA